MLISLLKGALVPSVAGSVTYRTTLDDRVAKQRGL